MRLRNMSKTSPLVSICVPSFNSACYLKATFNSLMSQTYRNIELVFVDDCSSDRSWEIAREYEPYLREKFSRVVLLKNDRNLGTLRSMHNAFQHMTGDLASYLDGDDYLEPTKVEKNVQFLCENPDFGAVHSDFNSFENSSTMTVAFWRNYVHYSDIPQGWVFEALLKSNFIQSASMMVRKELWDRCYTFDIFEARNYKMGDYPGHLNVSQIARIGYIDEPLVHYRIRRESMSHSADPARSIAISKAIAKVQQDARLGLLQPLPAVMGKSRCHESFLVDGGLPANGLAGIPTTVL